LLPTGTPKGLASQTAGPALQPSSELHFRGEK
jgi:hypothetical protein